MVPMYIHVYMYIHTDACESQIPETRTHTVCVRVGCVLCTSDVCKSRMRVCEARVSRIESRVESPKTLVSSASCETQERLESRD